MGKNSLFMFNELIDSRLRRYAATTRVQGLKNLFKFDMLFA